MSESYLNIAAGKLYPIDYVEKRNNFLVQLDQMYYNSDSPAFVESSHDLWTSRRDDTIIWCDSNVFDFLANYRYQFDNISFYRFLEHVTKSSIQYFIYLVSTAIKVEGIVDVIVPNYETLAKMILEENLGLGVNHKEWEQHDTLLTYELLNEPAMPHASIWTPNRIKYFFELEGRFRLLTIDESYEFDGRNIYIRAKFKRVK